MQRFRSFFDRSRRDLPPSADDAAGPLQDRDPVGLLRQAARCYAQARWSDDATRLYREVGDYLQVGILLESLNQWEQAAHAYVQARQWERAATCFQQAERPTDAAECLWQGGQRLQAAWIWADQAHEPLRARLTLAGETPTTPVERLTLTLIKARCDVAQRRSGEAIAHLRHVVAEFPVAHTLGANLLFPWSLRLAEVMKRPDLIQLVFARAQVLGYPEAQNLWETWAKKVLKDGSGVPSAS